MPQCRLYRPRDAKSQCDIVYTAAALEDWQKRRQSAEPLATYLAENDIKEDDLLYYLERDRTTADLPPSQWSLTRICMPRDDLVRHRQSGRTALRLPYGDRGAEGCRFTEEDVASPPWEDEALVFSDFVPPPRPRGRDRGVRLAADEMFTPWDWVLSSNPFLAPTPWLNLSLAENLDFLLDARWDSRASDATYRRWLDRWEEDTAGLGVAHTGLLAAQMRNAFEHQRRNVSDTPYRETSEDIDQDTGMFQATAHAVSARRDLAPWTIWWGLYPAHLQRALLAVADPVNIELFQPLLDRWTPQELRLFLIFLGGLWKVRQRAIDLYLDNAWVGHRNSLGALAGRVYHELKHRNRGLADLTISDLYGVVPFLLFFRQMFASTDQPEHSSMTWLIEEDRDQWPAFENALDVELMRTFDWARYIELLLQSVPEIGGLGGFTEGEIRHWCDRYAEVLIERLRPLEISIRQRILATILESVLRLTPEARSHPCVLNLRDVANRILPLNDVTIPLIAQWNENLATPRDSHSTLLRSRLRRPRGEGGEASRPVRRRLE